MKQCSVLSPSECDGGVCVTRDTLCQYRSHSLSPPTVWEDPHLHPGCSEKPYRKEGWSLLRSEGSDFTEQHIERERERVCLHFYWPLYGNTL